MGGLSTSYKKCSASEGGYLNATKSKWKGLPIVLDTGASWSVTPNVNDFVGEIDPAGVTELKSLDAKIQVHGVGTVKWEIRDAVGEVQTIRTKALYVPSAEVGLFSPQVYLKEHKKGELVCQFDKVLLWLPNGIKLEFLWQELSNLPFMLTDDMFDNPAKVLTAGISHTDLQAVKTASMFPTVLSQSNLNLTGSQKELLLWHQHLGHASLQRVQSLLSQPRTEMGQQVLFPRNPRASSCELP
jgi:hypothetical protein